MSLVMNHQDVFCPTFEVIHLISMPFTSYIYIIAYLYGLQLDYYIGYKCR